MSTEITFRNVTITMRVVTDAKAAYSELCDALHAIGAEWETDTYEITGGDPVFKEGDASELWGK